MSLHKNTHPGLKLEEGEKIELSFSRAGICYALLWGSIIACMILMLVAISMLLNSGVLPNQMGKSFISLVFIVAFVVIVLFGVVSTIVYKNNKLFITNKRVTQFTMASPIVTSVNIIDLSSIEDVSFRQNILSEKLFSYGTLRLSTVGDETTYTFPCVQVTPEEIARIVKLVNDDKEKN